LLDEEGKFDPEDRSLVWITIIYYSCEKFYCFGIIGWISDEKVLSYKQAPLTWDTEVVMEWSGFGEKLNRASDFMQVDCFFGAGIYRKGRPDD
jgi:hypothetical protein